MVRLSLSSMFAFSSLSFCAAAEQVAPASNSAISEELAATPMSFAGVPAPTDFSQQDFLAALTGKVEKNGRFWQTTTPLTLEEGCALLAVGAEVSLMGHKETDFKFPVFSVYSNNIISYTCHVKDPTYAADTHDVSPSVTFQLYTGLTEVEQKLSIIQKLKHSLTLEEAEKLASADKEAYARTIGLANAKNMAYYFLKPGLKRSRSLDELNAAE